MSSQEPPKNKSKRDDGLFYLYNECTCVRGCILCQYAPARTVWKITRLIMAMNHKQECFCKSASAIIKHAPPQDAL